MQTRRRADPDGFEEGSYTFDVVNLVGINLQQGLDARLDTAAAVPEPATWAMMIAGFGLAGASVRRRHRRAHVLG